MCDKCRRRNPIRSTRTWLAILAAALLGLPALGQEPPTDAPAEVPEAPAAGAEAPAEPEGAEDAPAAVDPEVTWATWRQETLPAWAAREETANRKAEARQAFFDGTNGFADAFPTLVGAHLDRPAVVRGRLVELQERATDREAERQQRLPDFGDPERTDEVRQARARMLEAEVRADAWVGRLMTRIEAFHQLHPHLTEQGIAKVRAPLVVALEAARIPSPDPVEQAALDKRAARADAALASFDQLQHELMLHSVADRPLPDIQADLEALSNPDGDGGAAVRLGLMRPFLAEADKARVDAALAEYAKGPAVSRARVLLAASQADIKSAGTELIQGEVGTYESAVATAKAAVAAKQAEIDGLPEVSVERPHLQVELEALQNRQRAAEIRLERVRGVHDDSLDAATAAAERARREAEEAAASAADDQARARAEFLGRAADVRERGQKLGELLQQREREIAVAEAARAEKLAEFRAKLGEIEKASPLPGSGPDADKVYRGLREFRASLVDGTVARGVVLQEAENRVSEVQDQADAERKVIRETVTRFDDEVVQRAAEDWREALAQEITWAEELSNVAYRERQEVLTTLQGVSEIRRSLRPYASWDEREVDQRQLGADVAREVRLLAPTVRARVSNRLGQLAQLPWRILRDATLVLDIVSGLFWLVVLVGAWYWGRGKSQEIAGRVAVYVKRLRPDLRPIDAARLKGPTADAVRATIDLTLGYLMVWGISPLSSEIAFVVEAWLLIAIYRALLAVFDLAVVRAPEFRPSLIALAPNAYDLLRFTARVAIIWGIARGFTYYVLWSTLQMDTVAGLVMTLYNLVLLGLCAWLLYQWDPILRERVRSRNQESQLVVMLSRDVWEPFRPFTALAMIVFFAISLCVDLLYYLLARDRTGFARVFNVITRYQMGAEKDQSVVPIPQETIDGLCSRESGHAVYVQRPDLDTQLDEALAGWKKDGRRGMVALVGDRGTGKRTEIARFLKRMEKDELDAVRLRLDHVEIAAEAVLAWLADSTGVEHAVDADTLVQNLRQRERTVFVVEQAHRAYVRAVGGFEAISQLLYVLNATSDHHFWLVSFHGPAWAYLSAIPSIVDVGVFRSVVPLKPFDAPMLRELAGKRAKGVGLELDYRGLMSTNLLGADPAVELERAINAFYRLLAEASDGNPRVAMHLFAACLEPGERGGFARVLTRKALRTEVASELSVDALFTLTALRQEDAMGLDSIVEVTNLPVHTVRNTVRDLQSRGLVDAAHDLVYIPIDKLPLVSRTLRRRHLMHLGA